MLATLKWFCAALLVLVVVSEVNAQPQPGTVQIIITGHVGGVCPSMSEQFRDNAWPSDQPFFYTQMTGCTTGVKIIAYDNQTDIPFIRLTNTAGTTNACVVGIGDYPLCSSSAITPRGRNFAGIVTEGFTSQLMGGINGNVTGDISVTEICRFRANGNLNALLSAQRPASADLIGQGAIVEAGAIITPGQIQLVDPLSNRKLLRVEVTGDVTGSISNNGGPIGNVLIGGNLTNCSIISTHGNPVIFPGIDSIEVHGDILVSNATGPNAPIRARGGIAVIRARSITGSITANVNNGGGRVGELTTGWNGTSGGFSGRLEAEGIQPAGAGSAGVRIAGNFSGVMSFRGTGIHLPVVIDGDLVSSGASVFNIDSTGRLQSAGSIRIGGSLLGNIWVGHSTLTNALQGQIVIGANGLGTATWSGVVSEDGIILSSARPVPDLAPYYARPSAQLGGGAVGLVPYYLYANDCSPPHAGDGLWNTTPGTNPLLNSQFSHWTNPISQPQITHRSATMSFYGRVGSNAPKAVSVWVWLYNHLWLDVTDKCNVTLSGRNITISGIGNQMLPPGYYAATAPTDLSNPNRLFCLDTFASTPPSVEPNASDNTGAPIVQYDFYLFPDCEPDNLINLNGMNCNIFCYADADNGTMTGTPDGGVTIDDLLYYLIIFNAGRSWADIDNGSSTGIPDGGVTIDDLLFFLVHFEAGC